MDIHNAIPLSCDTFYYTLANRLGIDEIAKYGTALGLGLKTGIDLPDEAAGTMPSSQWKLKTQHAKWFAGETISVGIGQGAVTVTPVQLARALGGITSGGALHRPHIVFPDEVPKDDQEAIASTFPGSGDKTVAIAPENWQLITDAMAQTTTYGTAATAHLEGIDFIGKTGTAQVMSHDALARSGGGHKTDPNAWFVGMAPAPQPGHRGGGPLGARQLGQELRQAGRAGDRCVRQQAAEAGREPAPGGSREARPGHRCGGRLGGRRSACGEPGETLERIR